MLARREWLRRKQSPTRGQGWLRRRTCKGCRGQVGKQARKQMKWAASSIRRPPSSVARTKSAPQRAYKLGEYAPGSARKAKVLLPGCCTDGTTGIWLSACKSMTSMAPSHGRPVEDVILGYGRRRCWRWRTTLAPFSPKTQCLMDEAAEAEFLAGRRQRLDSWLMSGSLYEMTAAWQ